MIEIKTEYKAVAISARAKLNLTLDITGRRDDGYHDIDTVMQSVTLADIVTVTARDNFAGKNITVRCSDASLDGGDNLAARAAALFFEFMGAEVDMYGTDIYIEKHIPVAAGLAGGSADAAAVLTALNLIYGEVFDREQLRAIGLRIGADVPFCIEGGTLLARGVGELLSPVPSLSPCHIVIVKSGEKASTGALYRLYDEAHAGQQATTHSDAMYAALEAGSFNKIGECLYNAFEPLMPREILDIKAQIETLGALGAALSGSGPSVFGLFDDIKKARTCLNAFEGYGETFLCAPASSGCEIISIS